MIAFLVCTLLLIFAVGAKVAVYHPTEPGTRSIAATKAWQAKQLPTNVEPALIPIAPQAELILLLELLVVVGVMPRAEERSDFHLQMYGLPSVAVRPPPPIF